MRFTWDPRKATANLRKHRVSFQEAASVFADPLALYIDDVSHADRMVLVGQSDRQRIVLTVFVELDEDTIRIVSARRVTTHERRRYEEADG